MALFRYSVKNQQGQTLKGKVEAHDVDAAEKLLRDRELIVISLLPFTPSSVLDKFASWNQRVGVKHITFFSRQLAVLINATIPMVRALRALVKQTTDKKLQNIVTSLASDVDGGAKLSQAMSKYPQVFDGFFVHMIRAGETTGRLDQVLTYLADQKEQDYNLRSQIRGALIYPMFIISTMTIVGTLMMIYVVPQLTDIITQNGGKLPITTQILIGTSNLLVHYWWLIIVVIVLIVVGYKFVARVKQGRYYVDLIKIQIPVIGDLYKKIALARFSMSFSNLLGSGVPIVKALEISGDVMNNAVYKELVDKTIIEVQAGNSMETVFVRSKHMPVIVSQMISIGEETGRLDDILKKMAKFYLNEINTAISTLTSLIEPVIIIVLGIAAAIMVTGILTPIYSVTESIG